MRRDAAYVRSPMEQTGQQTSPEPDLSQDPRISTVEAYGGRIEPLGAVGARVSGIDLAAGNPPPGDVREALESLMASVGFLVFRNDRQIEVDDFLEASCWWGGRQLHSTHGVHPATP